VSIASGPQSDVRKAQAIQAGSRWSPPVESMKSASGGGGGGGGHTLCVWTRAHVWNAKVSAPLRAFWRPS
jgi:hypothetical protein